VGSGGLAQLTSMATGEYEHQYTSLVATLSKRDGLNAILNRENDEKKGKVTRNNQRKLIISFILASLAVQSSEEGLKPDTAFERCGKFWVTFQSGLLGCNERGLRGQSLTHLGQQLAVCAPQEATTASR